ncbi:baseplate multidomain protein megatron [Jannaschia seohaensis]|uniref:Phage tail protein n=1 Tax=Jannaschia seohaensis TaxID=475081 RepID=A0A2Y9AN53_9RHOB|nr:glycoside hydrolase/phage tail family protein [Jannaschia seohaensis]PWJ19158.1 putative tail protein [Jannaschia seohaensis]SSA45820.1 Putative phage tail protein [Jannaschia seohaensis]
MATLVLGAAGAAIGGSLGGSVLGLSAAVIGRAAGATLGRVLDQHILGGGADAIEHGRIDRFRLTGAAEGATVPRVTGRMRVGGQVIWASRFKESRETSGGGGKGTPNTPKTTTFSYSVSFALALCEGEIRRIGRIWADGEEIARDSVQLRLYHGSEDQQPDALIEAIEGTGQAPAFRGTAYVVIEDLELGRFGNRVPQLSFEVVRAADAPEIGSPVSDLIRGVAIVPGTGEYSLATSPVHFDYGGGLKDAANVNTVQEISDFEVSLRDLTEELPQVGAASLVVSWFGDDLRCGACRLRPRVEQTEFDGTPMAWEVSGMDRASAETVPLADGRPVYGGTPADAAVIEAIQGLTGRGIDVTFYPFILMEQLAGNGLPDPYGQPEQAALPWRGRITTALAPGQPGTTDRTAAARAEVDAFFGTVRASDFALSGGDVVYSGPAELSYSRFILHYAALCAAAGGVEGFCIGSEMRGLTRIRADGDSFPAVERLRDLLEDVRLLLPGAKLGYAADWSEYFGYHPSDTGDVHFHLDPVWSHPDCDFVGIDNYMPLTDWRDGSDHLDAGHGSILNPGYLRAGVIGGEGYDWYYPDAAARDAQARAPITDGAYGEPWVFRYKDLQGWWSNMHHDRISGVRQASPTGWVPMSKPIRFTEYGCAAIDKGTNQPNKFLDPKSSESRLPHYSAGTRDDAVQQGYLDAMLHVWSDAANNPVSALYGAPMLDLDHSFVWAWDARPWPAFPQLLDYWNDGANYARGHWVNGRSGLQSLAQTIAEICRDAGIVDVDVSAVRGVLRGHQTDDVQSGRADLQSLLLAYAVEAVETGGKLVFGMREVPRIHDVSVDDLVRAEGPTRSLTRSAVAEIPGRVRVGYGDAMGQFEARMAEAVHPGSTGLPVDESSFPLSLTAGEGHALAERFLAQARVARDGLECGLGPSRRDVAPGDLLRFEGEAERWRIDRIQDEGMRLIRARRVEPTSFRPGGDSEDPIARPRPSAPLPVEAVFLDLPLLTGEEVPRAPYVAAAASPWPGTVAVQSSVEDSGYVFDTALDVPAAMGVTLSELPSASPGRWDRGADLLVRIPGAELQSVSDTALRAGANALAIGSGATQGWEILQFRDASLVEPDVWALSMRLRGQRGTTIPANWPLGAQVVILDGALGQVHVTANGVGLPRHYRLGAARLPLDHPSVIHREVTPHAVGLRPFSPVHLRADWVGGDLAIQWVRRTRAVGEAWGTADVPLAEASERYRIEVSDDLGATLVTNASSSTAVISAAELTASGLTVAPFRIRVAQISDVVGPGAWAEMTLS